jgi:hypothetical protein
MKRESILAKATMSAKARADARQVTMVARVKAGVPLTEVNPN